MGFTGWGIGIAILGIIIYEVIKRKNEGQSTGVGYSGSAMTYNG